MTNSSGVTIASLQIENVKRVKAVRLQPSPAGLTIIGGRNGQGKTSVLDAIAWALGGGKQAPSNPQRDGSLNTPEILLQLSNGLRVERKGKNSSLTVIDPAGGRGGQQLLDAFVSQFALDLPKFMDSNSRDKAQILLKILGIGDQLAQLDQDETRIYNERHAVGQIADSKEKHATELPQYADAPDEPVSVSELIRQQQNILAKNGENQRKREQVEQLTSSLSGCVQEINRLVVELENLRIQEKNISADIETAKKSAQDLQDESTAEIEVSISNIESINSQVSANAAKSQATDEAAEYRAQYDAKTTEIDAVRSARLALLTGADLPLPGLSVVDGEIVYDGKQWDCMAGSEQLKVAVAIVRGLNPECRFVLMDKLEQMDMDTLSAFGAWLEIEGLQVIATRVSTGEECTIVIEDGLPVGQSYADVTTGVNSGETVSAGVPKQEW